MKKIGAILLCALMLLGGAVAEENMQAWTITVTDIEVAKSSDAVELSPTLLIHTGRDSAGCWAQLSVQLDGESALTGQAEYVGDTLFSSVDGASDALLIDGAEMFLNQYGMSGAQVQAYIDALYGLLNTGTNVLTAGTDPEAGVLDIQMTGENEADFSYTQGSISVSARLSWERIENELPYDLSEKNVCRYTFREMFPGDGTDIPETIVKALSPLLADPSVQALMELFSGVASM